MLAYDRVVARCSHDLAGCLQNDSKRQRCPGCLALKGGLDRAQQLNGSLDPNSGMLPQRGV